MPAKSQIKKAIRRQPEALAMKESKADLLQEGLLFLGLGSHAEQFGWQAINIGVSPFVGNHSDKLVPGSEAAAGVESRSEGTKFARAKNFDFGNLLVRGTTPTLSPYLTLTARLF